MSVKFLFLPLVLVSVFFAGIFWGKPMWQENKALERKVAEYAKELNEIKGRAGFAQKAVEQYSALGEGKVLIENALPEEKEGNVLMAEFFEKAKKAGVFLKNIKIDEGEDLDVEFLQNGAATDGGSTGAATQKQTAVDQVFGSEKDESSPYGLKMTKSTMELTGSYEEIRNFILEVEKMNRFVDILSVGLKRVETTENSGTTEEGADQVAKTTVQVNLESSAYWLKSRTEEIGQEEEAQMTMKTFSGDPILKDLLSGKFSSDALTNFQNSITKDVFQFSGEGDPSGFGRTSLF